MHTISVKNFGPIKEVEFSIEKLTVIIGEQASGKSTVAKLVYYFRKFKNHFAILLVQNEYESWNTFRNGFLSQMKNVFTNTFGMTKTLGTFEIQYYYNEKSFVSIKPTWNGQYLDIDLSNDLYYELKDIFQANHPVNDQIKMVMVTRKLMEIFEDEFSSIYIPAGRALLSRQTLLDLIQTSELSVSLTRQEYDAFDLIDAMTRDYMKEVSVTRAFLAKADLNSMEIEMKTEELRQAVHYMCQLQLEIIKGTYHTDGKKDYICLDDKEKMIPVSYVSSGQQEVLWITNILLRYAAWGIEKTCIIVEEPETHLHPDAQYALAKFIAAFQNATNSQVVITTHSPYVLTSFNNLFYAERCAQKGTPEEIGEIIAPYSWIQTKEFQSFCITDGLLENIKDENQAMIDVSVLDGVASRQDDEYERMSALMWR